MSESREPILRLSLYADGGVDVQVSFPDNLVVDVVSTLRTIADSLSIANALSDQQSHPARSR